MTAAPFIDTPTIGAMDRAKATAMLEGVGELGDDEERLQTLAPRDWWPFGQRVWASTAHSIGFLPKAGGDIQSVGEASADEGLKGQRVNVALNALRVADYPGGGNHRVLFDFYARNQVPGVSEDLHFNATYRVREGERAAVRGYPIFVGLTVGSEGLALRFYTVNVKNDTDEGFLDFLEGDVFKQGLKLATTAQPAIAPLSGMALALTKSIAKRNRNIPVQDCYLGLDFAGTAMGARLAEGDYIAVQIPESLGERWSWEDWAYQPAEGLITAKADPATTIPYNYVVFGVSRYQGD